MTLDILKQLTAAERIDLLAQLIDASVAGPQPLGPGSAPGRRTMLLPLYGDVGESATVTVTAPSYQLFKPKRLVVLDVLARRPGGFAGPLPLSTPPAAPAASRFEVLDFDEPPAAPEAVAEAAPVDAAPPTPVPLPEGVFLVPRSAWDVDSVFIGSRHQWASLGTIGGDAFGPCGTFDFDGDVCQPGFTISVTVRHAMPFPVRFRAVLLGETIEETVRKTPCNGCGTDHSGRFCPECGLRVMHARPGLTPGNITESEMVDLAALPAGELRLDDVLDRLILRGGDR